MPPTKLLTPIRVKFAAVFRLICLICAPLFAGQLTLIDQSVSNTGALTIRAHVPRRLSLSVNREPNQRTVVQYSAKKDGLAQNYGTRTTITITPF